MLLLQKNTRCDKVVKYFTANSEKYPAASDSFYPLPDDNSVLSPNCSSGGTDMEAGLVEQTNVIHV